MKDSCIVVAIDGEAASGKGTVAKRLAAQYGFSHLDTGLLYRAVTLSLILKGRDPSIEAFALAEAQSLDLGALSDPSPRLHSPEVSAVVSVVAKMPRVRSALFDHQRNFPTPPGSVLDGRDIGTEIFPDALLKFYFTASPEARAARVLSRMKEQGLGNGVYGDVLANILERDRIDSDRKHAPMRAAEDAHIIDTTDLDKDQAYQVVKVMFDMKLECIG